MFSAWVMASTAWFCGYEYSINRCKGFGIVEFQDPSLLACVVFVKHSQTQRLLLVYAAPSPRLEGTGVLQTRFLIQIVRVKDQRLSFGVEHAAVGLLRLSVSCDVMNFGNIQIARAHQLANVAIMVE